MTAYEFTSYEDFRAHLDPVMTEFLEQKSRLEVEIILFQFRSHTERLTLEEIAALFDAAASSGREVLLIYLSYGRPRPASSLAQIGSLYDTAAAAVREVLVAALRHLEPIAVRKSPAS